MLYVFYVFCKIRKTSLNLLNVIMTWNIHNILLNIAYGLKILNKNKPVLIPAFNLGVVCDHISLSDWSLYQITRLQ